MSVSSFTSVFSPVSGRLGRAVARRVDATNGSDPTTTPDPVAADADDRLPSRRELWDRVRSQAEAASNLPDGS
ncbi:MAG TPA: hypothetical protein VIP77_17350 [Jiangellaceae bacterium]